MCLRNTVETRVTPRGRAHGAGEGEARFANGSHLASRLTSDFTLLSMHNGFT